ncbi:MAG: DUF4384 domain-containing protein [Gemmatimonadota bacterium]
MTNLALLAVALMAPTDLPARVATTADDPPVRIWLNDDGRYTPGDRVRVQVRAADDGYLLVLHVDPDGRLRVLFPVDPGDDNFVRGGKKYEIKSRGGRETFRAPDADGNGMVYAAWSLDPFRFDDFISGDHWDYRALAPNLLPREPEPDLTDLVRKMTSRGGFDYDVITYTVYPYDRGVATTTYVPYAPWYGWGYGGFGCWSCGPSITFGIAWGYRPWYRYDPFFFHDFYDPFFYRPVRHYYPVWWGHGYRSVYPPFVPVGRPLIGRFDRGLGFRNDYRFKALGTYTGNSAFPYRERVFSFSGDRTENTVFAPTVLRSRVATGNPTVWGDGVGGPPVAPGGRRLDPAVGPSFRGREAGEGRAARPDVRERSRERHVDIGPAIDGQRRLEIQPRPVFDEDQQPVSPRRVERERPMDQGGQTEWPRRVERDRGGEPSGGIGRPEAWPARPVEPRRRPENRGESGGSVLPGHMQGWEPRGPVRTAEPRAQPVRPRGEPPAPSVGRRPGGGGGGGARPSGGGGRRRG